MFEHLFENKKVNEEIPFLIETKQNHCTTSHDHHAAGELNYHYISLFLVKKMINKCGFYFY